MSLQHIQKNSPGLLHTPAKFEKNLPNGHRVMRKRKHGAHRAGGARYPPIYKQAYMGRLINNKGDIGTFKVRYVGYFGTPWMTLN